MKASLLNKLQALAERQEELGALLADPQIIGDQNRFRSLSQEYAELTPVVDCYSRYRRNEAAIAESQAMLRETDREMQALAEEGAIDKGTLKSALAKLGLDPNKTDPQKA